MKLKTLEINNFRNFKRTLINLENKNIIFGMNDIGKTNLLYSIRFLLDKDIRKNGFIESDFYQKNINENIEIILTIEIDDYEEDDDTKKLIAEMHGAVGSEANEVYIKLVAQYESGEDIIYPKLYWGDNKENLIELYSNGPIYPIDKVFKVVYINPLVDMDKLFKLNKRLIFNDSNVIEKDIEIKKTIDSLSKNLNQEICRLSSVESFQNDITQEYRELRPENITIEMKSEMELNGYFNNIVPYIKKDNDSNHYPTGGDGRRKLLAYSILNLVNKKESQHKILIHLVEEPENSLHRSMQLALSKQLFNSDIYKHLFVSTHSPLIIHEMNNVNLIRIYSRDKIECSTHIYNITETYNSIKKKLNANLSNALFSERVLLVEGPSEKVLFEKIMDEVNPTYELNGGFILEVEGVGFKKYREILKELNIEVIIKTDNDLRKSNAQINKVRTDNKLEYELFGINRALGYVNIDKLDNIDLDIQGSVEEMEKYKIDVRKKLYNNTYKNEVELLKQNHKIYLSEVDLESDLDKVIGNKLREYIDSSDVIEYLYRAKLHNMVEILDKITYDDCKKIYDSEEFKCLREL